MAEFDKFLYTYVIFLFFLVFVIGLGATDMFAGNIAGLTAPTPPDQLSNTTSEGIIGSLTNAANTFSFFINNIAFFISLATVDVGVAWVTGLILTPAFIFLVWGLIKLLLYLVLRLVLVWTI